MTFVFNKAGVIVADLDYLNNNKLSNAASTTLTTPIIGAATGTSLAVTGNVTSSGGGLGYATGNGGTVTQGTSKTTGVTLNKQVGQVTMNNASLGSGAKAAFTVTNSVVGANDMILVEVMSGGTANSYRADVTAVAAGSFAIVVENHSGGSLSESPVIGFMVFKGVAA
jgi:hypothetical protein